MIWPWDRAEVFVTFSQKQYFRVSGALRSAGVPFVTKMPGLLGLNASRGRGVPVVNQSLTQEYRLFVRREDADRAQAAVAACLRAGER